MLVVGILVFILLFIYCCVGFSVVLDVRFV